MKRVDVIARLLESINRSVVKVEVDEGAGVRREVVSSSIDDVLQRARRLLLAASAASAGVDGYAARTPGNGNPGGGKGGRQMMKLEDQGEVDWVPTSSTESAALADGAPADPLARLGGQAWRHLQAIAHELHQLEVVIERAGRLQSTRLVPEALMCAVVQGLGLPWDDEWDVHEGSGARLTDFAGQLAVPLEHRQLVCRYVYRFVHNHKRLPTRDDLLAHLAAKAGCR